MLTRTALVNRSQAAALLALGCVLGPMLGCGDGRPYRVTPVRGSIAYEDGSLIPAEGITLRFESQEPPVNPKEHPRPGLVEVDVSSGEFGAPTTYDYQDGVVRGRHKVLVQVTGAQPGAPTSGQALIPKGYGSAASTPLEVSSGDSPFEFRIPKP